jgi:hypothetical protein
MPTRSSSPLDVPGDADALFTLPGSTAAVFVVTSGLAMLGVANLLWIAFGLSMLLALGANVHNQRYRLTEWLAAAVSGFLIFTSSFGTNQLMAGTAAPAARPAASEQASDAAEAIEGLAEEAQSDPVMTPSPTEAAALSEIEGILGALPVGDDGEVVVSRDALSRIEGIAAEAAPAGSPRLEAIVIAAEQALEAADDAGTARSPGLLRDWRVPSDER